MNIGTRKIVVDEAIAQLRLYAETNGAVLQYYDGLPGMTTVAAPTRTGSRLTTWAGSW